MKTSEFGWEGSAGGKIAAVEWRPDSVVKAAVALVHGHGEYFGRYRHVAEAFASAGIGMVALDMPGHGRSEGIRGHYSFPQAFKEVDRLLDEARKRFPAVPLFLYGHSLGGGVVCAYLIERKPAITGALVTSPLIETAAPVPGIKVMMAKLLGRIAPTFTMSSGLDFDGLSRDRSVIEAYTGDPLIHHRISARLGLDFMEFGQASLRRAAEITVPVLLSQGDEDTAVSAPAAAAFAKAGAARAGGTLIEYRAYPGHYHELHNEPDRDAFLASLVAWLLAHS